MIFLRTLVAMTLVSGVAHAERPNILIFMADDQYKASIGAYGAEPSHTPNIDGFAAESMRFTRCYTPSSICTPNRAVFLSGMYPLKNGAHANHSGFFDGVKSLPNYMEELGYRACLVNKDGIRKSSDLYGWEVHIKESGEPAPGATEPQSKRHRRSRFDEIEAFLSADDERPFCLLFASRQPHTPFLGKLPNGLEGYDASNHFMDSEFGEMLGLLETHGLADSTVVVYTNDNETHVPRSKYTLYETAVNVPMLVRWPGKVAPGTTNEAMVSFLDFLPTLVEIADGDADPNWDGKSMVDLWQGKVSEHRTELYFSYTGVTLGNNKSNEIPFPIRGWRTERYRYLRNINHTIGHPMQDGIKLPPEELYDLETDPDEQHNLADDPAHQEIRKALGAKVDAMMRATGDHGIESEYESLRRYGRMK